MIKLLDSWWKELQFEKIQVELLELALDEIVRHWDNLSVKIAKNTLQRHNLDKILHAKSLFNK